MRRNVDALTIVGWGMLLMPLLTMWHEIGGHAAFCAAQGGHVATIGAFYVDCRGLTGTPRLLMSCAGVLVNILLAIAAYACWRRAKGDRLRLFLWLLWVSEAFVASGYFLFSGVTGVGDLGTGTNGSLSSLPMPLLIRVAEVAIGGIAYWMCVLAGSKALTAMLGSGPETRRDRRAIAHIYYATAGLGAVVVGLMNPLGIFITIMSAAASSFGGLAGFISIGYANPPEGQASGFELKRNWAVVALGAAALAAFAVLLGPSIHFPA
ncbi:MAG: hypothetical protein ABIQ32_10955 [Sphingomicrobium sp.]